MVPANDSMIVDNVSNILHIGFACGAYTERASENLYWFKMRLYHWQALLIPERVFDFDPFIKAQTTGLSGWGFVCDIMKNSDNIETCIIQLWMFFQNKTKTNKKQRWKETFVINGMLILAIVFSERKNNFFPIDWYSNGWWKSIRNTIYDRVTNESFHSFCFHWIYAWIAETVLPQIELKSTTTE